MDPKYSGRNDLPPESKGATLTRHFDTTPLAGRKDKNYHRLQLVTEKIAPTDWWIPEVLCWCLICGLLPGFHTVLGYKIEVKEEGLGLGLVLK